MNLYAVISPYQFLCAVVCHLSKGDEADFAINDWLLSSFDDDKLKLLESIFRKVYVLDPIYGFHHSLEETKKYYASEICLKSYSEKYIWGGQYSLGVFLAETGESFYYGEEACGLMSRPDVLIKIEGGIESRKKYINKIRSLGIYDGSTECIKGRVYNFKEQKEDFVPRPSDIDFDITEALSRLPEEQLEFVIRLYREMGKIKISPDVTVFLTQHLANLHRTTFEEHIHLTQLFVDYFLHGSVVIKPHPSDCLYYSELFPESLTINDRFPSELMPFIFEPKPKRIATISSTAVNNLRRSYDDIMESGDEYINDYRLVHKFAFSLKMAQSLHLPVYCEAGVSRQIVENLARNMEGEVLTFLDVPEKQCLCLVEAASGWQQLAENLPEEACVALLNGNEDYDWYDYAHRNIWGQIVPVCLCKDAVKDEDVYEEPGYEVFYFFSMDDAVLEQVRNFRAEETLPHVGIRIWKPVLTEIEERIKILEGMVAASEKAILRYEAKE